MIRLMQDRGRCAIVFTLLLMPCGSAVAGVQDIEPPQGRGAGRAPVIRPAEVAAMLDAYELVQAQTTLQLDDGQYAQFVTRLKRLQETRRRHLMQRTRLLQELRKLTAAASTKNEAALRERLKALQELDEQAAVNIRRESAAVDELLDVRQQALFRLLEDRIERQKLDLLMRAQQRAARQGPRGAGDK